MNETITIEKGSGNVFADLGYPNTEEAFTLFFGLPRTGQIRLRRFNDWQNMSAVSSLPERQAT
jgi:hypothetical protein